jgi:hypothetical protein
MRIPVYEPTVVPEPMPTPFRSGGGDVAAGGLAVAEGIRKVAGVLGAIHESEMDKANSAVVTEAFGKLTERATQIIYDPQTGALSKHGVDARGVADQVERNLQDFAAQTEAGLTNQEQRRAFRGLAQRTLSEAQRELMRHELQEYETADQESTAALLDNIRARASTRFDQADVVENAADEVRVLARARGERAGWDAAQIEDQVRKELTKLHAPVFAQLVERDPEAARTYLDDHKDDLSPEAQVQFGRAADAGNLRKRGQEKTDRLWADRHGSLDLALQDAAEIANPELRDDVESRLRQRSADQNAALAQTEAQDTALADKYFTQRGTHNDIPVSIWSRLPSDKQGYFLREERFRNEGAPEMKVSDVTDSTWNEWYAYKQLGPEQKVGVNLLTTFRRKVPDSMVMQAIEEQESYRNALQRGGDRAPELTELQSRAQQVETAARRAGILPWDVQADETQKKDFSVFQSAADLAIRDFERNKLGGKRKATEDEAQPLIDRLLIHGEVPRPWYVPNPHFLLYTLPPARPSSRSARPKPAGRNPGTNSPTRT